ncbi:helix-turn-helix transcriptional regulator [Streptomyces sp. NPDC004959]|uniref:helix-turn-helix transcriptional regulator n=1 Tax=unclassified Streptomyces TaxID=2593676 RepID=UPI0033A3D74B
MAAHTGAGGGAGGAGGDAEWAADAAEIRAALLRLRRATGLPVAFGGPLVGAGAARVRIGELSGTATAALDGLAVSAGNGLGGKAITLTRPCTVTDYRVARSISHEYDTPVAAEGLRSVLAVPVVVRRRVRAVLYGALRAPQPLGDRTLRAAVEAARDVEQTLVVRDEARALAAAGGAAARAGSWREVRETGAHLRGLAERLGDPALRAELLGVCARLAAAEGGLPRETRASPLTPREVEVLVIVAEGATNAAVARRLGLRPETVKAYLRAAMRKLGARTRGEAVAVARRAGVVG